MIPHAYHLAPAIKSVGYDGKRWILIDTVSQRAVREGEARRDFRGDTDTIVGGRAPHKPGSTGRVHTSEGNEYYPSVFGLAWVRP